MNGQECRIKTVNLGGIEYARLTYPPILEWMAYDEFLDYCRDCGTPKGGIHHPDCCLEDCPLPDHGQRLMCRCGLPPWED